MPDPARSSHHPGAPQLAAFARGKLAGVERDAIQAHLQGCPRCRTALAALPGGAESASGQDTMAPADRANAVPGALPDAATAPRPQPQFPADLANHPRYEIVQLLGQGGMGAVYKARHKVMDRVVALKVINAQLLAGGAAVERFHREIKAAARLDHPNIVRAHDADQAGGTHFLVMEYVEGTDLAKYVERKGPLPVAHACHFVRQAALGLQHAHERGMVHRDIKPHNLMLTAGGVVKVMDFGLARLGHAGAGDGGLTGANVLMGTADYVAPEQAEDARHADIRADIYSLGCTLFHLLAGQAPFAGGTVVQKIMAHVATPPPLAQLPAAVPDGLRTVLEKMLAKDPAQRYQTPGEVAQALAPFIKKPTTEKPPAAPTAQPPADTPDERTVAVEPVEAPRARKRKRRQKRRSPAAWVGLGVIAAAVLAAAIVLLARRGQRSPEAASAPAPQNGPGDARQPTALPPTFTNNLGMAFVLVPKGEFLMGGGAGEPGATDVEIAHDFYLGKYEVTQGEWEAVMGSNPSHFRRDGGGRDKVANLTDADLKRFPVETVSWRDALVFVKRLNEREPEAGWVYRLPTEPEWEYACRGGPAPDKNDYSFDYYFDKPANKLAPGQANFEESRLGRTCKVGSYAPNRLGLFDMHGNVWEWAGWGGARGKARACRGGGWNGDAGCCRAADRRFTKPPSSRDTNLGLRVARVPIDRIGVADAGKAGWVDLLAGGDLGTHWTTTGNWKLEDGVVSLKPRPGESGWRRFDAYLWSKEQYRDFEADFEYKIETGGNSGFFFRVGDLKSPVGYGIEVQIEDSGNKPRTAKLADHDCGGIIPGVPPTKNAAKPAGEWNRMQVAVKDNRVTVRLNGEVVNDALLNQGKLDTRPATGYVGFQDAGLPVALRNVRIREL